MTVVFKQGEMKMKNCTVVYQSGSEFDYQYGAFHIKNITSTELQKKLNSEEVRIIDHIIEYKESLFESTHQIIKSEDGIIDFFNKWNVTF